MKIKKLTLSNFMAFENLQLDWSDNINVICGEQYRKDNITEGDVFSY